MYLLDTKIARCRMRGHRPLKMALSSRKAPYRAMTVAIESFGIKKRQPKAYR
jgi:hypothetical protein